MARTKNTDILARYHHQITRSKKWRKDDDYDSLWRRMVDLYRGKHYDSESTVDRAVVNMAFATKNVIAPSVAVNNPHFSCNARHPDAAPQALFAQEIVNYDWRTWRYQTEIRRAVDDWLISGHGWIKCGYKFVQEPVIKKVEEIPGGEDSEDEGVDDRVPTEGNTESEMKVVESRPFIERISVHDMFVDPDCTTLETATWIAQRTTRPIADVKVDSRYDAAVRSKVKGGISSKLDEPDHPKNQNSTDVESERAMNYVDVWEYYDLRKRVVCVFADGCMDGFLIKPKPIPYAFGHPFVMLRNYDVPDFFYPMGELEAIEGLQQELNEVRTSIMEQRRKYARKYLFEEDSFTPAALEKLRSREDNVLVPVSSGTKLVDAIKPLDTTVTPGDFYQNADMIMDNIQHITAVSDYMSGSMPEIRRTATEASLIQDAANARAADKLARLELFMADCAERVIKLRQQFMTGEETFRITRSSPSNPVWANIDRDYIAGSFDFEVEAGSSQPKNETFRRQSAMQLLDAMAQVPVEFLNMPMLLSRVLEDGFGMKDPMRYIQDPMAMQDPMGMPPPEGQEPFPGPQGGLPPGEQMVPQELPPQGDPSQLAGMMA